MKLSENTRKLAAECNDRHVLVVQAILSGNYSSNTKAYQSVYPDTDVDSANTSVARMLAIGSVKALHAALKEEKVLDGVLSRAEAMKLLSDMATTSMGDLVEFRSSEAGIDDDGNPMIQTTWSLKNQDDMTPAQLRSICELTATPQGFKIKQHDQKAAIKQLADMAGWNAAEEVNVNLSGMADRLARARSRTKSDE